MKTKSLNNSELGRMINESVREALEEGFLKPNSGMCNSGDKNFDKLANAFFDYVTKIGFDRMYDNHTFQSGRYMFQQALKQMEQAIKDNWSTVSANPNKKNRWWL